MTFYQSALTTVRSIFLLAAPLLLLGAVGCSQRRADRPTAEGPVWFGDLPSPPLAPAAEEALARHIARSVQRQSDFPAQLPPTLGKDRAPRIIFLSMSDGRAAAHVTAGAARGAPAAARMAVRRAQAFTNQAGYEPRWIRVDLVRGVTSPTRIGPDQRLTLPSTRWGIAWDGDPGIAFLPEELTAHRLVDGANRLQAGNVFSYLQRENGPRAAARDLFRKESFSVRRFQTRGYFCGENDPIPLNHGRRRIVEITPEILLRAAEMGGEYLVRSTGPGGRFDYVYDPLTDRVPGGYNILRHAGTTYSMFQLASVTGDERLLDAARQATGYLLKQIRTCTIPGQSGRYVSENGEVKLGGNALAILALVEHAKVTGETTHLDTASELADWILSVQEPNGRFRVHKQSHPDGKLSGMRSDYYPGEAVFALVRLYGRDKRQRWLQAAEKATRYLVTVRDAGKSTGELLPDHWLLYGLNELHRARPRELYLEHARRISSRIVSNQTLADADPGHIGSYYRSARSTPTATRTEGLCAAYALERDYGTGAGAGANSLRGQILRAVRLGARFQLRTQLRAESVMYFPDPRRSLGGFSHSLTDHHVRIDVVQHNISACLVLRDILLRRRESRHRGPPALPPRRPRAERTPDF